MTPPIFGNTSAEIDDLLYECAVDRPQEFYRKAIVTGRWGTGKTALIFLQGEGIISKLEGRMYDKKKFFYISEESLDFDSILEVANTYDHARARAKLETLWKAEILRLTLLP